MCASCARSEWRQVSAFKPPPLLGHRTHMTKPAARARSSAPKPAARGTPPSTRDLSTHPIGRRWAALALHRLLGWSASQVRKKVPKVTAWTLQRWHQNFDADGDPERHVDRKKVARVAPAHLKKMQQALQSGGQGQRETLSLRRAHRLLKGRGIVYARETWRKELWRVGWRPQPVVKRLPLEPWEQTKRTAFCTTENKLIGANTLFTDSKIFEGEPAASSKLGSAWGPRDAPPARGVKQKAAYQVHAYAGVCAKGGTRLFITKGTKGATRDAPGRPPKDAPPLETVDPASGVDLAQGSVDSVEYRRILDGPGGGLLKEGRRLFGQHVPWRFMQDGASGHTVADTAKGRPTRALISKYASLVEHWPPRSADLNPIEKTWSAVEDHLWTTQRWTNFKTFKAALLRSWKAVVTPAYCRKLVGGVGPTMRAVVREGGREIRGWGHDAK